MFRTLLFTIPLLLIGSSGSFALDSCVVPDTETYFVNEHSECREVTNTTGSDIMVPTKTAVEWATGGSSFLTNTPAGVNLETCSSKTQYKYISYGTAAVCAIGTDDKAYCWGLNTYGNIGDGTTTNRTSPTLVLNGDNSTGTYKTISVGDLNVCAIGTDDKAYCWGRNNFGQLGDGTTTNRTSPILVLNGDNSTGTYKTISSGMQSACAIGKDDKAYCWGSNTYGNIGDGTTTNRTSPTLVLNGDNSTGTYKTISDGLGNVCAIGIDDKAYCWGLGVNGTLGNGSTSNATTPVTASNGANTSGTYKDISVGVSQACGIGTDDKTYCWGTNANGEIGDGTNSYRYTPVLTINGDNSTGTYKNIDAGWAGTCAIGTDNKQYCWGNFAAPYTSTSPTLIQSGSNVTGEYKYVSTYGGFFLIMAHAE